MASDDGSPYHAVAVRFQTAGNDYLTTPHLDATNSPRGTYSAWLHFNAGDNQQQLVSVAAIAGFGGVFRTTGNKLRFLMQLCTGHALLDMQTVGSITTASGWVHVLAAWDLSVPRASLYIDDVADREATPLMESGNICYSLPNWGIGGLSAGTLDADVADVYAALGTFIDIDLPANRRLFSTVAGKPVELGEHCATPLGAQPTACFIGDVTAWNTNKGAGGGYVVNGDGLTVAPTSPSD